MKAIASVDEQLGIGKNGDLLVHNKEDMKFFKDTTMGYPVIMGRKTFESLPGVLKGRQNIVITRGFIDIPNVIVCHDYKELISINDAFVIGGGEIYKLFLPYYDEIYLTENKGIYGADTFFPNFDKNMYKKEIILEKENFLIAKYIKN